MIVSGERWVFVKGELCRQVSDVRFVVDRLKMVLLFIGRWMNRTLSPWCVV